MRDGRLLLLFTALQLAAAGCGSQQYTFDGNGEFSLIAGMSSSATPLLRTTQATLRHADRGTSELILTSGCTLRLRAGRVIGTQRCEVASATDVMPLNFQDGTWSVTDHVQSSSSDGLCEDWRYELLVSANGTVRGSTQAVHFGFRGFREQTICTSSDSASYSDGGTWTWDEGDDYSGDEYDDWEDDSDEPPDDDSEEPPDDDTGDGTDDGTGDGTGGELHAR